MPRRIDEDYNFGGGASIEAQLRDTSAANESMKAFLIKLLDLDGGLLQSLRYRLESDIMERIDTVFSEKLLGALASISCPYCCPHHVSNMASSSRFPAPPQPRPITIHPWTTGRDVRLEQWSSPIYVIFRGRRPGVYSTWGEWKCYIGNHPVSHSLMFASFDDAQIAYNSAAYFGHVYTLKK